MKRILLLMVVILLICPASFATVTDQTQRAQYTATADQTVFAYTWRVLDDGDMDVFIDGVLTTAYSVSNVGVLSGGNITFNTGRTVNEIITIIRNMPNSQGTGYPAGGRLSTVNLELNLDRLTMFTQDLSEEMGRALKFSGTSTLSDIDYPEGTSAADRATKLAAWNTAGTALELVTATSADSVSLIAVKGDILQGGNTGVAEKLGIGTTGSMLQVSSGLLEYLAPGSTSAVYQVVAGKIASVTNPILLIPTIADMTNATHDHADAAGGGNTLLVPTIASFANATHDHADAAGGGLMTGNLGDILATSITLTGTVETDANTLTKGNLLKGWLNYNQSVPTVLGSYNVASVTDTSAGVFTINWDTDFADTVYAIAGVVKDDTGVPNTLEMQNTPLLVGSTDIRTVSTAGTGVDGVSTIIAVGNQ